MSKYLVVLAALALASAAMPGPVLAQDTASKAYNGIATNRNIWEGIYTDEQAAEGQDSAATGVATRAPSRSAMSRYAAKGVAEPRNASFAGSPKYGP